ncbi:MaoC family dehydratase [Desertibaculum subflavum]|uniref:MaoC family dehydratase n=1 Tax=Desertibaculum subflavum TaxID=2268458 RepID=UPI000E676441
MNSRYFEDYEQGEIIRGAGITLSESDIIEFAFKYDPQPFHIDKIAASASIYGGLIASGWHVMAVSFRMLVQAGFLGEGSMGSPGLDELRWHLPTRPGDTLLPEVEVMEMRPSSSKPDRGIVMMAYRIKNQKGELVMSLKSAQLVKKRPA